ncbi:adenosylcobinamide-phosphate synthase CbiB [Alteromonas sp. 14N.309.X.WAT.G.H12]|uniref:adenosylcobinamide-phosphate synthase CbiB n=1 Tax=Alteromonas sp. 14N.309.X.WAT.G.H12 TaxID=3120824 RepID=UPI002FD2DDFA
MTELLSTGGILLTALLLDRWLGEPVRFHPLIGFGHMANGLEETLNVSDLSPGYGKLAGVVALLCLVLPIVGLLFFILHLVELPFYISYLVDSVILYLAIGQRSLYEHTAPIAHALGQNAIDLARKQVSGIVSRDTQQLSEKDIARATVESILENGHDAVIASLFYYLIGGLPLVILHRLINTLDAMWGYKNTRFIHFGWAAARFDDVMGWPSARLTALLYNLQKRPVSQQWSSWQLSCKQAAQYKSANGGMVMAAGANVLGIQLGGEKALYHGQPILSPVLGAGREVHTKDIRRSLALLQRSSLLLSLSILAIGGLTFLVSTL